MENVIAVLVALGIPTSVTGLCFWRLKRQISKRDAERERAEAAKERKAEERERNREKLDLMMMQSVTASMTLSEATARAVQRIPDARCNGDMSSALKYVSDIKHAQKSFLTELGIHSLYDD